MLQVEKKIIQNNISSNPEDKFYVYLFKNLDWNGVVFYIGKGSANRYKTMHGRNKHIQSIVNNYNCCTQIIINNLPEKQAFEIEKKMKKEFKMQGHPIIDLETQERQEHQRQGIEELKKDPKKWETYGRPKYQLPDNFSEIIQKVENGSLRPTDAIKLLNMKKTTYYKFYKQFKTKKESDNKIIYRPQRGSLEADMQEVKEFKTFAELQHYIVEEMKPYIDIIPDDVIPYGTPIYDIRTNWKNTKYVCIKGYDKVSNPQGFEQYFGGKYVYPLCIGMFATEFKK